MDYRKLSELRNWKDNPREATKIDMDNLKWGIQKYGLLSPLLILDDGTVIGGNHRLKALQELGIDEAWVNVVHPKSEAEMIEMAALDNQQTAKWLNDKLADLINKYKGEIEIERIKIETSSQSLSDLIQKYSPEPVEDEPPEVSQEPAVSVLGEVYQLGRHRVMCGDSTKIEDVEKLMDGKKADMVFTDPPYGMDLDTDYEQLSNNNFGVKSKTYSKVIGDDKPFDMSLFSWIDCDEQFWWGADWYKESVPNGGSWFVWDKRVDENLDNMYGSAFELCWSKQRHQRLIVRHKFAGFFGSADAKERMHPTQKAIGVCSWFIEKYSKSEQIILDLFLGSGSTLIACEQTNRICYGMELDPKYVDVIRKRYAKFIGKEDEWEELTPVITDNKQT